MKAENRKPEAGGMGNLDLGTVQAWLAAAATTFWAASVRPSAVMIAVPLSARIFLPSST